MSKSKNTLGPWKWGRKWEADSDSHIYDGSMGCLEPNILWYGMDGEENIYCPNKANATLIEAAPEMLEALEIAVAYIDRKENLSKMGFLKQVIAKAKGD